MDSFKKEEFAKALEEIKAGKFTGELKPLLELLLHNFQGFYGAYALLDGEEKPQYYGSFNESMRIYFELGQSCINGMLEEQKQMDIDVHRRIRNL